MINLCSLLSPRKQITINNPWNRLLFGSDPACAMLPLFRQLREFSSALAFFFSSLGCIGGFKAKVCAGLLVVGNWREHRNW